MVIDTMPTSAWSSSNSLCVRAVVSVVSDSLQSYGLQHARLLCSWDSPGKNTRVVARLSSRAPSQHRGRPASLMSPALAGRSFTTRTIWEAQCFSNNCCSLSGWRSSSASCDGSHSQKAECSGLKQAAYLELSYIFDSICVVRSHGLVHGILHVRILEWVAFPFSRGSSQPRNRTQLSHIAGRFITN